MKLPTFCIQRPVFATVLSLILVLIGIMGYQNLQTRFFPQFQENEVFVITDYPGASAKLIETSITTPIEKSISGIEGIDDIESISNQGTSRIIVYLKTGVNIYDVTNKIRDQVNIATAGLPGNVKPPLVQTGYGTMELMDIGFTTEDNHLKNLRDYLERNVIDQIEQVPGIAAVNVLGANPYAMRITLHPNEMTARNITVNQIATAITNNNLQLPAGYIQTPTMEFPVTAQTALHTINQFKNIVVQDNNGNLVHLSDVATVALGRDTSMQSIVRINNHPAILLSVYPGNDTNPIEAEARVKKVLQRISSQLPSTIHDVITFDQTTYMRASIAEVYKSIALATLFVAIIIFLSLGKLRSALIPIVTIPICIFATTGLMYFLGFSINIITLLAIVLSIGLVVDDSIVVLENIYRHMESGLSRFNAALKGAQEIATPVIAMTLTLAAVYAPIGLMKNKFAHIFASFAFTLAAAVIVSGFVALTLSPMMCSKFLSKDLHEKNKFNEGIEHFFHRLTSRYKIILSHVLSHRLKIIIITVIIVIAGFFFASTLPKTFLPKEDIGLTVTILNSASGLSDKTANTDLKELTNVLSKQPGVQTNVALSFEQTGDSNRNILISTLKPYNERSQSADEVANAANKEIKKMPGMNAASYAPSFGGSMFSDVAFFIMAPNNYHYLYTVSNALTAQLNKYPGITNAMTDIQFNDQQYNLTVNRALADQMQVNVSDIDNTLADFLGGTTVTTFSLDGQTYDVDMQAAKPYLQSVQTIGQFTVPTASGQLVPLSNLIHVTPVQTQGSLFHYNRMRAAKITANIAPGYSFGDVVAYLQKTLPALLPAQVKYAFTGQAQLIADSSSPMFTIFILAFVFIYLVLSAQFESFVDPFIILLAVPLSIIGALVSLKCVNGSINLYTMIGLVTLVGLIAKHGILITQFANTLQKNGETMMDALMHAASIRLRPILMTTAAMIFGALPLVLATGASAVSREQVGTVIVGGLFFGTFFSLILVPIAYSYFNQLKAWVSRLKSV